MVYADGTARLRALFLGSMTSAWYEASDDERRERILPRFAQLMNEWRENRGGTCSPPWTTMY